MKKFQRVWRRLCTTAWQYKMGAYHGVLRFTKKFPPPQKDGTATDKVIYLTFDDGPGGYTRQLLETLERYNVKATFFVSNCANHSHLLSKISSGGHTIGNHTACHDYKKLYADEGLFLEDLEEMEKVIWDGTATRTTLFRFPGGSCSIDIHAPQRDMADKLISIIEQRGYRYCDWDLDSGDTADAQTPGAVYKNVIAGVRGRRSTIVLQHDVKKHSVAAVEAILVWGLRNGYTFLPLCGDSPLVHLPPFKAHSGE